MFPGRTHNYGMNCFHSKHRSNFKLSVLSCRIEPSNFNHLLVCKLCPIVCFSAQCSFFENVVAMSLIFRHRTPFQIVCACVCFISVLVIDICFSRNGREKCQGNESVQADALVFARRSKPNIQITLFSNKGLQESGAPSPRRNLTSYAAKVRNAVKLVSFNWTPFFGGAIKWFGHKLYNPRFIDLAPMSVQPLAGVNYFYGFLGMNERQIL